MDDRGRTYRQEIADLTVNGRWYLYNYFVFQVQAYHNGQPVGYIEGTPTGENIGGCAICGTLITNHYSIRDVDSGRVVNVGSECIKKVLHESKATKIEKAVRSLHNKIRSEYLRPFKHELLSNWLLALNQKGDADVIRAPKKFEEQKKYWMKQVEQGYRFLDKERLLWDDMDPIESYNTLVKEWEETTIEGGPFHDIKYYWRYHARKFPFKDWNPDNMRRQYKQEAEKFGTELPPAWSEIKLTDDQKKEMSQLITKRVNEYLNTLVPHRER